MDFPLKLISLKQVSCINLIFYIIKTVIITIGDNAMAHLFKFTQIIYNFASKESNSVLQSWFVNYYSGTLGFDSFHDALDTALAEIIRIAFHSKAVYADNNFFFF